MVSWQTGKSVFGSLDAAEPFHPRHTMRSKEFEGKMSPYPTAWQFSQHLRKTASNCHTEKDRPKTPSRWPWWNERWPNIASCSQLTGPVESGLWFGCGLSSGLQIEFIDLKHPHPIGPITGRCGTRTKKSWTSWVCKNPNKYRKRKEKKRQTIYSTVFKGPKIVPKNGFILEMVLFSEWNHQKWTFNDRSKDLIVGTAGTHVTVFTDGCRDQKGEARQEVNDEKNFQQHFQHIHPQLFANDEFFWCC